MVLKRKTVFQKIQKLLLQTNIIYVYKKTKKWANLEVVKGKVEIVRMCLVQVIIKYHQYLSKTQKKIRELHFILKIKIRNKMKLPVQISITVKIL